MPSGIHTHWAKYVSRIITKNIPDNERESDKEPAKKEVIQLICEHDGVIFSESEIGYPKP